MRLLAVTILAIIAIFVEFESISTIAASTLTYPLASRRRVYVASPPSISTSSSSSSSLSIIPSHRTNQASALFKDRSNSNSSSNNNSIANASISSTSTSSSSLPPSSLSAAATCEYRNASWKPFELAAKSRSPPLLLSYPGSGNSWMRIAFEQITGYVSGALEVNDTQYQRQFKGEMFCGIRQSVVKAHPQDFMPYVEAKPIRFMFKLQKKKCKRGMLDTFTYIIFIFRNPADALWSQFQLLQSQSHVGRILKSRFNESAWNEFVNQTAFDWNEQWKSFIKPLLLHTAPDKLRILRYEDLVVFDKGVEALKDVATRLIGLNVTKEEAECALKLAKRDNVKRPNVDVITTSSSSDGSGSNSSSSSSSSSGDGIYATAGYAFYKVLKPQIACLARRELTGLAGFGNYSNSLAPTLRSKEDLSLDKSAFLASCRDDV